MGQVIQKQINPLWKHFVNYDINLIVECISFNIITLSQFVILFKIHRPIYCYARCYFVFLVYSEMEIIVHFSKLYIDLLQ